MKNIITWIALGLIFILALFANRAYAGLYLDLGVSYIPEVGLHERASVTFGGMTTTAERSITVDLDTYAPMARFGYLWQTNIGLEYDYVGVADRSVRRVNMFYRFEF